MKCIESLFINFDIKNINSDFSLFSSNLEKEILDLQNNYQLKIKTVYVATNDLFFLNDNQLIICLNLLKKIIDENLIEYSFEIGYDTLKESQLLILKQFKINRLVWKVRTFNNNLLLNINEKFNNEKLIFLIKSSFNFGFKNFSIDLEDNIKNQTKKDIINDLKIVIDLKAPHISYQSNNDFYNYENKEIISKFLKKYKYQNYEFFSFSKNKENFSQQTLGYLNLNNWYGLGPNASSFIKEEVNKFIISNSNDIPWKKEISSLDEEAYHQLKIIQGLTLRNGFLLTKDYLKAVKNYELLINELINKRFLQLKNNHLKTTKKGWALLNKILIDIINNK